MSVKSLLGEFTAEPDVKLSVDVPAELDRELLRATRARVAVSALENLDVKRGKSETIRMLFESGLAVFWARWAELGPRPRTDEECDRLIEAARKRFGPRKRTKAEK